MFKKLIKVVVNDIENIKDNINITFLQEEFLLLKKEIKDLKKDLKKDNK